MGDSGTKRKQVDSRDGTDLARDSPSRKDAIDDEQNNDDDEEEDELIPFVKKQHKKREDFDNGNVQADLDRVSSRMKRSKGVNDDHRMRECSGLYASSATWHCAMHSRPVNPDGSSPSSWSSACCVPCAYKIACFDVALDKELTTALPNDRPEKCPRLVGEDIFLKSSGVEGTLNYLNGMKVLVVGDGDLSFSLALSRMLLCGEDSESLVVATSYESKETLMKVYPSFPDTIQELEAKSGVKVVYNVDATCLTKQRVDNGGDHVMFEPKTFDRIIWNFPCSAMQNGQDGQNAEMDKNKELVKSFMKEALALLKPNVGQIHMNHKTRPPFDQWKIQEIALQDESVSLSLSYWGCVVWDRALFPPYIPRKALHSKSFPTHDACVFVFVFQGSGGLDELVLDGGETTTDDSKAKKAANAATALVPITRDRIVSLREKLMLQAEQKQLISSMRQSNKDQKSKRQKRRR